MEKGIYVKDITVNAVVNGIFAVKSASLSDSRNGMYWKLELADRSGSMLAMIWAPLSQRFTSIEPGLFVSVNGQAQVFREKLQLNIKGLNFLESDEEVNMLDFLPASPWDINAMEDELFAIGREEFLYSPWRRLVFGVLEDSSIHDAFISFPAARSIHQAYAGGLLEHSLAVCKLCRSFCNQYESLDRQTLLAAALLHDVGKVREFTGGIFNDYTSAGSLAGHIFLGLEMLAPHLAESGLPESLQEHFRHLVLSHHGQREFGAPVLPQTPEAFALHTADLTDARISQCRSLFESASIKRGEWSAWQTLLDRKLFNPPVTPDNPVTQFRKEGRQAVIEEQWSLPFDLISSARASITETE